MDVSGCRRSALPSGQGIVLLEADGHATSVVVGGANTDFPQAGTGAGRQAGRCIRCILASLHAACIDPAGRQAVAFLSKGWEHWAAHVAAVPCLLRPPSVQATAAALSHVVKGAGAVMLQREVPEHVNEAVAAAAAAAGVPVLLVSAGGPRVAARAVPSAACHGWLVLPVMHACACAGLMPAVPPFSHASNASFPRPRRTLAARTAPLRPPCCASWTTCALTSLSWRASQGCPPTQRSRWAARADSPVPPLGAHPARRAQHIGRPTAGCGGRGSLPASFLHAPCV